MHAFPLNTITSDLRQKLRRAEADVQPVQRLKRARSILAKLAKEPSMRLTQMQDIGGCRAVVGTLEEVAKLRSQYRRSKSQHVFVREDDYIVDPKVSGYRSLHLIFRFKSRGYSQYNNLLFEVQLRTAIQHAWATAVETVGAVIGQALKSSEGEAAWLSFFQHAALALEYTENAVVAKSRGMSKGEAARTLSKLAARLDVFNKLAAYSAALKATDRSNSKRGAYFLLTLLPETQELQIRSFTRQQAKDAYKEYEEFERRLPLTHSGRQLSLFPELSDYSGAQVVLVGAHSLKSVRDSYPNYYLDTKMFIDAIGAFIRRFRRVV
jgi:hypothetical protein